MAYLLGHALYKGALFLVAGAVDHETGTRDSDRLGGLGRAMPLTALAAGVAALSMAGMPPLSGFFAKLSLVQAGLGAGQYAIVAAALAVGLLTLFSMTKIWAEAFWKPPPQDAPADAGPQRPAAGQSSRLLLPIGALAALTVAIGLGAEFVFALAAGASEQMLHREEYIRAVLGGPP